MRTVVMTAVLKTVVLTTAALALSACGDDEAASSVDTSARAFDGHECAACGMIVREQPSPRGQLVHRDGTREYFCAIADMHAYLEVPSSHGEPVATYVEVLAADADPAQSSRAPERWVAAEDARYVLDVERNDVMGRPVLSYATPSDATQAAERLGGRVVTYAELRAALDEDLR